MAPRQQHFELVPDSLRANGPPRPPMTSKQAKKAYAARSKLPAMSRAERNRLEKEELECQRKERDKERAAEKAKKARDKKAQKAQDEIDRRRKAGLPLKDVRPSQPTLTSFAARGIKRGTSEISEENTEIDDDSSVEEVGPIPKKVAVSSRAASVPVAHNQEQGVARAGNTTSRHRQDGGLSGHPDSLESPGYDLDQTPLHKRFGDAAEDTWSQLPAVRCDINPPAPQRAAISNSARQELAIDEKILPEAPNARLSAQPPTNLDDSDDGFVFGTLLDVPQMTQDSFAPSPKRGSQAGHSIAPVTYLDTSEDEFEFGSFPDISPQTVRSICKSPDLPGSNTAPSAPQFGTDSFSSSKTAVDKQGILVKQSCSTHPADEHDSDEFGDFPELSQSDLPRLFAEPIVAPKPQPAEVQRHFVGAQQNRGVPIHNLKDHIANLEDTRVMYNKPKLKMKDYMLPPPIPRYQRRQPLQRVSSNTHIARPSKTYPRLHAVKATSMGPVQPPAPAPPSNTQKFLEENFETFFPSPSQQVQELMEDVDHFEIPSNSQVAREISEEPSVRLSDMPTPITTFADRMGNVDVPISTQFLCDFELSSQDLREIETPSKATTGPIMPVKAAPLAKPKGRFFEEKEEDLLAAAIYESRKEAEARERFIRETTVILPSSSPPQKTPRTLSRVLSDSSDYGDDFDSCSQELLQALALANGGAGA